jgi:MFS family permease
VRNPGRYAFAGVAYAFTVTMLGTTIPTPLYPLYQRDLALSPFTITIIYAAYAVGVLAALLFLGQLSDRIGRKRVLLPGLVLSAASAIAFLSQGGLAVLFVGRVLSGLSAGIFTGTATATLLDLAPAESRARATQVATVVNMAGLGLGPVLAGLVSQYAGLPLRTIFIVDLVLLVPAVLAILALPEPAGQRRSVRLQLTRVRIPADGVATFVRASVAGFAGFVVLGFFSALAPTLLGGVMGEHNRAVVGAIAGATFGASVLGQLAMTMFGERRALPWGCAILIAGLGFLAGAVEARSIALLVVAAIVSGFGQGLAFRAGLGLVGGLAGPEQRAEVTSAYFVVVYVAISLPVVGVGLGVREYGIRAAGLVTAAIVAALAAAALVSLVRPRPAAAPR